MAILEREAMPCHGHGSHRLIDGAATYTDWDVPESVSPIGPNRVNAD